MAVDAAAAPSTGETAVLTDEALEFVAALHARFEPQRAALLAARAQRHARLRSAAERPDFLAETATVRSDEWTIEPVPAALQDRRCEITGPTERKMLINAFNSGARVFMADFEDANSPTWENMVCGQANLIEAIAGTIELETPDKTYRLSDDPATLCVRPRGWHLPERHVLVDGLAVSGALFDFGMFVWHSGEVLASSGRGPFMYLPKLESHLEARLWNEVFTFAEDRLSLPRGTIRATVLIEHILAAFEMDEILYELREHAAGLNAGRWDYIFSAIKSFPSDPAAVLPDRAAVTMTVPFMRAYTELLISTCHRRGAHAIGGMAAFIPSRRDPEVNETAIARVREDKQREAADGCDGSWVAHPDLVPIVTSVFDEVLGEAPNQVATRRRDDVSVSAEELLDFRVPDASVTAAGVENNVAVSLRYIASWLGGLGAVAIFDLMEDAATAEIARSQLWQWLRHGRVQRAQVDELIDAQRSELHGTPHLDQAVSLLQRVALSEELEEFLTLPGYELLREAAG
jgi:malate synthase